MKVKSLSVQVLATPWTAAYQAPPCMGSSRQEYWSGVPFPSPKTMSSPSKRVLLLSGLHSELLTKKLEGTHHGS